jgi:hypothetical protein
MSVPLCSTPALCALGLPVTSLALLAATATFVVAVHGAAATELTPPEASIEQRVQALVPSLEDYIAVNLKAFDVPGLAIGIVGGDRLIYAKGFGFRRRGGAPVDTQTIFQIGSGQRRFLPQRWRSPSTGASFIGTTGSSTSTPASKCATHGSRGSSASSTCWRNAPGCRPTPTTSSVR